MHRTAPFNVAVASGFYEIGKPDADGLVMIQITPDGEFGPSDGRPMDVPAWRMNAENAQRVIAAHASRKTPTVVDYEHQTLHKEKNGQPAPAAAWLHSFEYRPGAGLFAKAKPTARASQLIKAEELLFFSPVFEYDRQGNVLDVVLGAFTNTPAIDGMAAVELAAASAQMFSRTNPNPEKPAMSKTLLAALCVALSLAETATDADVIAAVDQLKKDKDESETKVAALNKQVGAAPDPSKFVPIDAFNALQTQVAALSKQQSDQAAADLVEQGEAACKITAATKGWFAGFAQKDIEGARAWLDAAPVIAALSKMQSDGTPRPAAGQDEITDPAGVAVLARKYQDEQRAAGVEVSTAAAVDHVTKKKDA